MMKGDKIKLKKKIGTFGHIGAICTVIDVSEDGIISFRYKNKYEGCISEDVRAEYFDEVHKWSEWRKKNGGNYFNSDGRFYAFVYEYRTDGKKIQVRSGKYKAEACCHKDDTYNEEIGLFLASNRLFIKILQDMVNSEIRQMKYDVVDELFRNVAKASAKLGVKFV